MAKVFMTFCFIFIKSGGKKRIGENSTDDDAFKVQPVPCHSFEEVFKAVISGS